MAVYRSISPIEVMHPFICPLSKVAVHSYEGLCYHMQGNWFEAIACLETDHLSQFVRHQLKLKDIADSLDARSHGTYKEGFRLLFEACQLRFDLEAFEGYIEVWDAKSPWQQLKDLGDAYYKNKLFTKALYCYQQAMDIEESQVIYNNMALTYLDLRDYRRAEDYFNKALGSAKVTDERIYLNKVQLYKQQGRLEEAYDFIYSLEAVHQSPDLLYEAGDISLKRRQYAQALIGFLKSYELENRIETYIKVIETRIESKDLNQALIEVEHIQVTAPRDYVILKAKIYERNGDLDKAIDIIESALPLPGESYGLYKALTAMYRKNNQIIKAIQSVNWLMEHGENPQDALYEMALIAKKAGKYSEYYHKIDQLIVAIRGEVRHRLSY